MRGIQTKEKSHDSFEGVVSGGDGAVVPRLGITLRFEDSDVGLLVEKFEHFGRIRDLCFELDWNFVE